MGRNAGNFVRDTGKQLIRLLNSDSEPAVIPVSVERWRNGRLYRARSVSPRLSEFHADPLLDHGSQSASPDELPQLRANARRLRSRASAATTPY